MGGAKRRTRAAPLDVLHLALGVVNLVAMLVMGAVIGLCLLFGQRED